MTVSDSDFHALMARIKEGDKEAGSELVLLYSDTLLKFIRCHFGRSNPARRLHDSSDVAQMIWADFFRQEYAHRPWLGVDHFARFLFGVAAKKSQHVTRSCLGPARDLRRDSGLESIVRANTDLFTSPLPDPRTTLGNKEMWELLVKTVPPARRGVLELLGAGHAIDEVAAITVFSASTIRRLLDQVRTEAVAAILV